MLRIVMKLSVDVPSVGDPIRESPEYAVFPDRLFYYSKRRMKTLNRFHPPLLISVLSKPLIPLF